MWREKNNRGWGSITILRVNLKNARKTFFSTALFLPRNSPMVVRWSLTEEGEDTPTNTIALHRFRLKMVCKTCL